MFSNKTPNSSPLGVPLGDLIRWGSGAETTAPIAGALPLRSRWTPWPA